MKKWTAVSALFIFICFPILFFSEQDALLGEMRANAKGDYCMYLFGARGRHALTDESIGEWGSFVQGAALQEGAQIQFTAIDLGERRYLLHYGSGLDEPEHPVYMLFNHARIVLQTTRLEQVMNYLQNTEVKDATTR